MHCPLPTVQCLQPSAECLLLLLGDLGVLGGSTLPSLFPFASVSRFSRLPSASYSFNPSATLLFICAICDNLARPRCRFLCALSRPFRAFRGYSRRLLASTLIPFLIFICGISDHGSRLVAPFCVPFRVLFGCFAGNEAKFRRRNASFAVKTCSKPTQNRRKASQKCALRESDLPRFTLNVANGFPPGTGHCLRSG